MDCPKGHNYGSPTQIADSNEGNKHTHSNTILARPHYVTAMRRRLSVCYNRTRSPLSVNDDILSAMVMMLLIMLRRLRHPPAPLIRPRALFHACCTHKEGMEGRATTTKNTKNRKKTKDNLHQGQKGVPPTLFFR